jgi:hypothetical protein
MNAKITEQKNEIDKLKRELEQAAADAKVAILANIRLCLRVCRRVLRSVTDFEADWWRHFSKATADAKTAAEAKAKAEAEAMNAKKQEQKNDIDKLKLELETVRASGMQEA